MRWYLRSYSMLVNERGQALQLIRGTWRHPEQVVVLAEDCTSEQEKQNLLNQGMKHVCTHIIELENGLLDKLQSRRREAFS